MCIVGVWTGICTSTVTTWGSGAISNCDELGYPVMAGARMEKETGTFLLSES